MMATPNSAGQGTLRNRCRAAFRVMFAAVAWILIGAAGLLAAETPPRAAVTNSIDTASRRYYRLYSEARTIARQQPDSLEAAWHFARACYDWADFSTNDTQRAEIAEEGIAAGRRAIRLRPDSAAGHYYLGLNLGQLAQTKLLGALKIINEIEKAWLKAAELDERFDYGGPHRTLAILYRDAPRWSVGDKAKSRRHARRAVALHPEYPGNHLTWLECLLEWDELKAAQAQIEPVEGILKSAREKFTGSQWARDWEEWNRQWRNIKARVGVRSQP